MPLIPSQPKRNREALTVKLDKTTIDELKLYAEFIDSTQEHVVNEALRLTFKKDKEFEEWREGRKGAGHATTA